MQLANGARVTIVGGGPAGSFTALNLLRFAALANLRLNIEIFEVRDFNRPGPEGCNKCAGILSSQLVHNLKKIGLEVPADLVQAKLDTYVLHIREGEICIHAPQGRPILSVYRGGGPRWGVQPLPHAFDGWLLEQAGLRGAVIHHERVRRVRPGPHPTVVLAHREIETDLVIVATGINTRTPLEPSWGYHSPRVELMAQDEIFLPAPFSGSQVHVFFTPPRGLIFGALVPKGLYASVSLLGHALPRNAIEIFLQGQHLQPAPPSRGKIALCGCSPFVAVSAAKGYFADRMVTVGDCAVTRLYKDGLGTAFVTAESAARTAVEMGVTKEDFAAAYRPTCQQIAADNRYGWLLFRIWVISRHLPSLLEAWEQALVQEEHLPPEQQMQRHALWGLFTGDASYRQIFRTLTGTPALGRMAQTLFRRKQ